MYDTRNKKTCLPTFAITVLFQFPLFVDRYPHWLLILGASDVIQVESRI